MQTQLINFVIPEKLLNEVDRLAKEDSRSRSELLREAIRLYLKEQTQRKDDFALIKKSAKRISMKEEEAIVSVDKVRRSLSSNT